MVGARRRVRKVNFRFRNTDLNTEPSRTRQVPGGYGEFRGYRLCRRPLLAGGSEDYGKRFAGAERFNVSRQRNGEGGPEGGGSSERSGRFRKVPDNRDWKIFFAFLGPFSVFFHVLFRVAFLERFGGLFGSEKIRKSIKNAKKT